MNKFANGIKNVYQNNIIESCTVGDYCPSGSYSQTKCKPGYYCPDPTKQIKCDNDGSYCPEGSSSKLTCPIGYYCPTSYESVNCPLGTFCPAGSNKYSICPSGRYCSTPSSSIICPAGKYCPGGSTLPLSCPSTTYCPSGSSTYNLCPSGYICPNPSISNNCPILPTNCPAGTIDNPGFTLLFPTFDSPYFTIKIDSAYNITTIRYPVFFTEINNKKFTISNSIPPGIYTITIDAVIISSNSRITLNLRFNVTEYTSNTKQIINFPSVFYAIISGAGAPGNTVQFSGKSIGTGNSYGGKGAIITTVINNLASGYYKTINGGTGFGTLNGGGCSILTDSNNRNIIVSGGGGGVGGMYNPKETNNGGDAGIVTSSYGLVKGYASSYALKGGRGSDPFNNGSGGAGAGMYQNPTSTSNFTGGGGGTSYAGGGGDSFVDSNYSSSISYFTCSYTTDLIPYMKIISSPDVSIVSPICTSNSYCPSKSIVLPCPEGSYCVSGYVLPCPNGLSCSSVPYLSYPTKDNNYYLITNPPQYTNARYSYPPFITDSGNGKFTINNNYIITNNYNSGLYPITINYTLFTHTLYINLLTYYENNNEYTIVPKTILPSTFNIIVSGSATPISNSSCREGYGGVISSVITNLPTFSSLIIHFSPEICTVSTGGAYSSVLIKKNSSITPLIIGGGGGLRVGYRTDIACGTLPNSMFVLSTNGIRNEEIGNSSEVTSTTSTSTIDISNNYVLNYNFSLNQLPKKYVVIVSIPEDNNVFPKPCPTGSYCPSESFLPLPCPAGTLCSSGNSTPCPAGSYCPTYNSSILCPYGTYNSLSGQSSINSCLSCPVTEGLYCPIGSIQQVPCPSGSYCNNGIATICPEKTYNSLAGQTSINSCLICPEGSYCTNGIIRTCPSGSYCKSNVSIPTMCEPGTYNASSGNSDRSSCIPCPAGSFCMAGTIKSCPIGSYCPNNNTTFPTSCGDGKSTITTGSTSVDSCIPCPAGSYCTNGATLSCPAGSYCPSSSVRPKLCSDGYMSTISGQSACKPCNEGFYCPIEDYKEFYAVKQQALEKSPDFIFSYNLLEEFNLLKEMTIGMPSYMTSGFSWTFTNKTPLTTPYMFGFSMNNPIDNIIVASGPLITYKKDSPFGLPAYMISPIRPNESFTINWNYTENTIITFHNFGYDTTRNLFIKDIQIGRDKYNYASLDSTDMFSSNWNIKLGIDRTLAHSLPCPKGYICPANSTSASDHDSIFGSKKPGPQREIRTCSTYGLGDKITFKSESTSKADCEVCPPGYLCDSKMKPCPYGYYCPGGNQKRLCPNPTVSDLGAKKVEDCFTLPPGRLLQNGGFKNCAAGYYCPIGTNREIICPPGTFSFPDSFSCIDTPAGYTGASVTIDNSGNPQLEISDCPFGFYCPLGNVGPIACPFGTAPAVMNLSDKSECYTKRIIVHKPKYSNGDTVQLCPPRYYCPSGNEEPIKCPLSSYAGNPRNVSGINLKTLADCNDERIKPKSLLGMGSFIPGGTTVVSQTYINEQNQKYVDEFNNGIQTLEIPLILLDYTRMDARDTYFEYFINPSRYFSGKYDKELYMIENKGCPDGYFCQGGNIPPLICDQPGMYCPLSNGIYGDQLKATLYPPNIPHPECPPGSYCPDVFTKIKCPAGTFNPIGSKTSSDACLPCPHGSYCVEGAFSPTKCTDSINGIFFPDNYGYNTSLEMCRSSLVNRDCPAGFYCPTVSSKLPCPIGFYCLAKSMRPLLCPIGTYCACNHNILPVECKGPDSNTNPNCTPGCSTWSSCPEGLFQGFKNFCTSEGCYGNTGYHINTDLNSTDPLMIGGVQLYKSANKSEDIDWDHYGANSVSDTLQSSAFWIKIAINLAATILAISTVGVSIPLQIFLFVLTFVDEVIGREVPVFHIVAQSIMIAATVYDIKRAVTSLSTQMNTAGKLAFREAISESINAGKLSTKELSVKFVSMSVREAEKAALTFSNNAKAYFAKLVNDEGPLISKMVNFVKQSPLVDITENTLSLFFKSVELSQSAGATIPTDLSKFIDDYKNIASTLAPVSSGAYTGGKMISTIEKTPKQIPSWAKGTAVYLGTILRLYQNGVLPKWYEWAKTTGGPTLAEVFRPLVRPPK